MPGRTLTPMSHQPPQTWGPHHQQGLPGGITPRSGGYWWAITTGTWLAAFTVLGESDALSTLTLAVLLSVAAAAVGWGEAQHGKLFASGHWVLFASAALASSGAFFLPPLAYVAGYVGHRHHVSRPVTRPYGPGAAGFASAAALAVPEMPRTASSATTFANPAPSRPYQVSPVGGAARAVPVVEGGYFGVDDTAAVVSASARGAALVIGPPGSGKTQSVIMPSVAYAPGAVVSTSMKAEVLAATHVARSLRGTCWLFDPGGASVPAGMVGLRWNPLCDVTDWDAARSVAARLAGPSRAGAGASHEGDHWTDRAETWLSVLLYAAKLSAPGGDIAALARWSMNPTSAGPECEAIFIVAEQDGDTDATIAEALLVSLLNVPDRERESIASTLGRIMNIYTSSAALRSGVNPNFDVHAFVRSTDTVYITAPVDRQRDYAP